ncbi:glycosyltransferase [Candidatus Hepatincola sp. Av]
MAKVTICIPVYNTHKYLKQCLDSVIQQTFTDIEIIIVNDASSSNLEENIILDYQQKDNRIKYIKHETNLGLYHARETAVFVATSPYIFFLDSDDYLVNNAIELLFNKINNTKLDFVYGSIIIDNNQSLQPIKLKNKISRSIFQRVPFAWHMFPRLFKSSIVKNVYKSLSMYTNNIHINLSEDFLFHAILALNSNIKYIQINHYIYFYRKHNLSLTSSRDKKDKAQLALIINSQLTISNIILKYLEGNNLLPKYLLYYQQLIKNQLLNDYAKHIRKYYKYITINNLTDNILPNFNKYVIHGLLNNNASQELQLQKNTSHKLKNNIFIKIFKKFERNIKTKIVNYKYNTYLNKCYQHNLKNPIDPWQELKKHSYIAISTFGNTFEDSNQEFLKYLFPKQSILLTDNKKKIAQADSFILLGYFKIRKTLKIIQISSKKKITPHFLEDGFLRSVANVHNYYSKQIYKKCLAFTLDSLSVYYDANKISSLEQKINSNNKLTKTDLNRAKNNITKIIDNNLSKYNDQDGLPKDINLGNNKKKVLVIDQSIGDNAVLYGRINKDNFNDMLNCAIAENLNADIIVKTHPDMLFNKYRGQKNSCNPKIGYISHLPYKDNIIPIKRNDVNPIALLKEVDKVYVCSSLMGMEALMCGKEVITFGVPFYAGWGLTDDRHVFFTSKEGKVRRNKKRSLEELFYYSYIWYSRYVNYKKKCECTLEEHIDNLIKLKYKCYNSDNR